MLKAKLSDIRIGVVGLEYAEIHNEGGDIPVTAKSRRYFMAKFKETGKRFWFNMARKRGNSITMPKRQFIGNNAKLLSLLENDIEHELKRLT